MTYQVLKRQYVRFFFNRGNKMDSLGDRMKGYERVIDMHLKKKINKDFFGDVEKFQDFMKVAMVYFDNIYARLVSLEEQQEEQKSDAPAPVSPAIVIKAEDERAQVIDYTMHFIDAVGFNLSRIKSLELLLAHFSEGVHWEKFVPGAKMREVKTYSQGVEDGKKIVEKMGDTQKGEVNG